MRGLVFLKSGAVVLSGLFFLQGCVQEALVLQGQLVGGKDAFEAYAGELIADIERNVEGEVSVAVWPFKEGGLSVPQATAVSWNERLLSALLDKKPQGLRVVSRRELATLLKETYQITSFEEVDNPTETLARNARVRFLIIGDINRVGKEAELFYRVYEIKTGTILGTTGHRRFPINWAEQDALTLDAAIADAAREIAGSDLGMETLEIGSLREEFNQTVPRRFSRFFLTRLAAEIQDRISSGTVGYKLKILDVPAASYNSAERGGFRLGGSYSLLSNHIYLVLTVRNDLGEQVHNWTGRVALNDELDGLIGTPEPDVTPRLSAGDVFRDCGSTVVVLGDALPSGMFCGPQMVLVPGGSFMMGSTDEGADADESPVHRVSIDYGFAVGRYEVTWGEFSRFVRETGHDMGEKCRYWGNEDGKWKWRWDASRNWRFPGFSQSTDDPVVCVSWEEARAYVDWLSKKSGHDYRLLTEAEWEYAARAGTMTAFSTGKDRISTAEANFDGNYTYNGSSKGRYRERTTPVGTFQPNNFGLYDVHGNVWEWVADCYDKNAYETHQLYPQMVGNWHDSCNRVVRGGSWDDFPRDLRSAYRLRNPPTSRNDDLGFRVARTVFTP